MGNRKNDVGEALTEIRTVRSRAVSAINRIDLGDGLMEHRRIPAHMDDDEYVPTEDVRFRDPDADEMVALLKAFVAATEKFKGRRN